MQRGGFVTDENSNTKIMKRLADLSKLYKQQIITDRAISDEAFEVKSKYIGKVVAKETLLEVAEDTMKETTVKCLSLMLHTVAF